jgi:hypothetical protein
MSTTAPDAADFGFDSDGPNFTSLAMLAECWCIDDGELKRGDFDVEKGQSRAEKRKSRRPFLEGATLGGERPFGGELAGQKTAAIGMRTAEVGRAVKFTAILTHLPTGGDDVSGGENWAAGKAVAGGPQEGCRNVAGELPRGGERHFRAPGKDEI